MLCDITQKLRSIVAEIAAEQCKLFEHQVVGQDAR